MPRVSKARKAKPTIIMLPSKEQVLRVIRKELPAIADRVKDAETLPELMEKFDAEINKMEVKQK